MSFVSVAYLILVVTAFVCFAMTLFCVQIYTGRRTPGANAASRPKPVASARLDSDKAAAQRTTAA